MVVGRSGPADKLHEMPTTPISDDTSALLAAAYRADTQAAIGAGVAADPEAQLTTPLTVLFSALAKEAGIGALQLIRENQLDGSRPDFGALLDGRFCGWIELKGPLSPARRHL